MAAAQPRCVYCGAGLPPEAVAAAAAAREAMESAPPLSGAGAGAPGPPTVARTLVILDLAGADPPRVAAAAGVSDYEAAQWVRRGRDHLLRIVPRAEVEREVAELRRRQVAVVLLEEEEVRRARPLLVTRGGPEGGALVLRGEGGEVPLRAEDVLLLVKGPIAREYLAEPGRSRRARHSALDAGYRYHLHRRLDERPLELDPARFDFGRDAGVISSVRELAEWMNGLFPAVPSDDTFRLLPPALAPAAEDEADPLRALAKGETRTVLDNVAQFRFHSAWKAALVRRRAAGNASS